ncbi:MAG: T9SS type A sorting domain-containing protein [Paludibacter sp.]
MPKPKQTEWLTLTAIANGTSGKCGTAVNTFDIKTGSSRSIVFFLAKCDKMTISANIAAGRGLLVNINDAATNIQLDGTGACKDYEVPINSESNVKIKVTALTSSSAWTSFFTFTYAPKTPIISAFKINGTPAVIDQTAKTITLQMPWGTDITNITPEVTISSANFYTPAGAQNFSTGPIVYAVTNGTTTNNYSANITAKANPDTDKAITLLTINGRSATINEATGAISCDFPSFTGSLGNWPVAFTLSGTSCSANFTSGNSYDFGVSATQTITVTAQDLSTKVYTINPTISTKKNIGMLTLNGKAESYDNILLTAFSDYYVNFLTASATAPTDINAFYANYDLIVLHSNVGGTNATAVATKALVGVKPMLNLKSFFYTSGRWAWSTVAPANAAAGVASADVQTILQSHPIFANVNFTGTTLLFFDNLPAANANAIQYASDLATLTGMTSQTIATVNTTGIQMHEIQDNIAAKFVMVALGSENNNYNYLNSNSINILKNSAAYLLNTSAKYTYPTTGVNKLNEKSSVYFSNGLINNPEQKSIVIYSAAGIRIKTSNEKTIDTQSMSKGVYLVQTDHMNVFKFIK